VIQSMTKTDTANVGETVDQIEKMVSAGCEIVRLAVPDNEAAIALKEIRKRVPEVPIVADIHFHYKLALMALEAGIDKLRPESRQHRQARTYCRSCPRRAGAESADSHRG
jgi:(E)-4-hydroxy-3-methylbut-2-enyl-diphosphate synthase